MSGKPARRRLGLLLLFATFLLLAPSASRACSTSGDYTAPSNFELAGIADAVVIATARSGPRALWPEMGAVTFSVDRILKGAPPRRVRFELAWIGRDGGIGMCNRSGFEAGKQYLLFLTREADGRWGRVGMPFAPDAAEYDGENGLWARTVRRYLALQRLAPMDAHAALERLAQTGLDADGRALAPDEREDVYSHLRSVTPWKPTAWLLDIYGRLERGEPLPYPPPSTPDEPAAAPVDARRNVLRALALGQHPEALPLIERLSSSPSLAPQLRGPILRYFANHGRYDRAYDWIETQLLAQVMRLPEAGARALLAEVADVQRGDSYEVERARWRGDPRAAASWPELALSLYRYRASVSRNDDGTTGLREAIAAIPLPDRRARPEVTAALGALFDADTRDWARAELARPQVPWRPAPRGNDDWEHPADRLGDHPDLLPLRVLASAWVASDEEVLRRAFCAGGERRRLAIHALGQWGDTLYGSLLPELAAASDLSAEHMALLRRAAILMDAREIGDWGTAGLSSGGGDGADNLVSRLTRGEGPASVPDPCRAAP